MVKRVDTYSLISLLERYNIIREVITLVNKGYKYDEVSQELGVPSSFISKVVSANKDTLL